MHIIPTFWPATAWGGPIFSTLALCDGLARTGGVTLSVLTTDAAGPGKTQPLDVPPNVTFAQGYRVRYYRHRFGRDSAPALYAALAPHIARADLVHLTATYSGPTLPTLALAKLLRKPLVWSPRGALQARQEWQGARSRAKVAFETACRRLIPARAVLHVTADSEKHLSQRVIPIPAAVVPNAIALPPDPGPRQTRPERALRLAFLSRIHPKKGVETLLAALTKLPTAHLAIYGDGEASYLAALRADAASLGVAQRVSFHGHVDGAKKAAAYEGADLFVLPSYSENFGMVIAEALAHRTPVVTTTATPWEALGIEDCGVLVPPGDPTALARAIASLADADLATMGERGRRYVAGRFGEEAVAQMMLRVYRDVHAGRLAAYA